jgi:DNA-binding phage protein
MDEKELLNKMDLMVQEELSLQKEIDTLNKNIDRKNEIIFYLIELIIDTENEELIKKMQTLMAKANGLTE